MNDAKITIHTAGPVLNGTFQRCEDCLEPLIDYRGVEVKSLIDREVLSDRLQERERCAKIARESPGGGPEISALIESQPQRGVAPLFWLEGAQIGRKGSMSFMLPDRALEPDEELCAVAAVQ